MSESAHSPDTRSTSGENPVAESPPWERLPEGPIQSARAGMLVDLRRCIGCHGCSIACKTEHAVPLGNFRMRTHWIQQPGKLQLDFVPLLCMHCADAPCIESCTPGAITRRADGRVVIDSEACTGEGGCVPACPYDAIALHPQTGKADKCDLCEHRSEVGMQPACVESCPTTALVFGDLDDPDDPVARAAARPDASVYKADANTSPHVVYLGHEPWMEQRAKGVQLGDGELGVVYAQTHDKHLRHGDVDEGGGR